MRGKTSYVKVNASKFYSTRDYRESTLEDDIGFLKNLLSDMEKEYSKLQGEIK